MLVSDSRTFESALKIVHPFFNFDFGTLSLRTLRFENSSTVTIANVHLYCFRTLYWYRVHLDRVVRLTQIRNYT